MYISPQKKAFLRALAWTAIPVVLILLSSFTYILTEGQGARKQAETCNVNEATVDSLAQASMQQEQRRTAAAMSLQEIRTKIQAFSKEAEEVLDQLQAKEDDPETSSALTTAWSEVETKIKQAKGHDLFRSDTLNWAGLKDLETYAYSLKQRYEVKEVAIRAGNTDDPCGGLSAQIAILESRVQLADDRLQDKTEQLQACEQRPFPTTVDCSAELTEREREYLAVLWDISGDVEEALDFIEEVNNLLGKSRTNRDSAKAKLASAVLKIMVAVKNADRAGQ